ncbi:hypothetical protein GX50_02455 [[Emmonsia] crescens]|uniref:Ecp2 effector protein domain-containing protein n=1 Tax=[Emmonsia] crescens TaxID=73230 RepID=A0A2B7ZPF4_9EURO|nr:hypothetical protein GX50_02455 [Emmonsia crescens]
MRSLPTIVIALLAAPAFAKIFCFGGNGSSHRVSKEFALQSSKTFCRQYIIDTNGQKGREFTVPYAESDTTSAFLSMISQDGHFTESACTKASEDIINQCFGKRDGGKYTDDSGRLSFTFCSYAVGAQ